MNKFVPTLFFFKAKIKAFLYCCLKDNNQIPPSPKAQSYLMCPKSVKSVTGHLEILLMKLETPQWSRTQFQKYLFFVVQKKGPMAGLQWFNDYVRADPGLH